MTRAVLAPALLIAACAAFGGETPPNILFLSADTLRADALGCYGAVPSPSPNLDTLAAQSLLFTDCVCDTPLTGPSFSAMLTSAPPRANGATHNGLRVSGGLTTTPELFKAAGYHTWCVQSTWTLKARLSGLDRGFDRYDEAFHKKRWGVVKAERPADEVTDAALRMLGETPKDRPFFAWVHYIDPHAPYVFHAGFNPSGSNVWRMPPREGVRARYRSEVAFMDRHIGRLLEALPENTVVLFVADHGESLYEHGYLGHGRHVYHDNLRVPLMIRAPGTVPGRTDRPAQGIDIGPTLLGLAGIPRAEGMTGLDLLRDPDPEGRVRVVETYGGAVPKLPGFKLLIASGGATHQGVIQGDWKLILPARGLPELYDLSADPAERRNLVRDHGDRVEQMSGHLDLWLKANNRAEDTTVELTAEDEAALRSLGYLR